MLRKLCLLIFGTLTASLLYAGNIRVIDTFGKGNFPIVTPNASATLIVDSLDAKVVHTASGILSEDVKAITGSALGIADSILPNSYPIVAGTIGQSRLISQLVEAGKINTDEIENLWEAFEIIVIDNPYPQVSKALIVCGSNPRGTAYGLLSLSRMMGVSPYVWWADVTPAHKSTLSVEGTSLIEKGPSVKYRGIFINDEDWGLLPWARKGIDAKYNSIGPNTYQKIAELMLRLRANTLWPAKHGASRAFWSLNENIKVADDYGLIMSSGDPMLRDNLWEWPRFGGNSSNYSYSTNKDMMLNYWAQRVCQSRGHEAIYDISTRGFQDEPLLGYSSDAEAIKGITGLIADQRKLLRDSIGDPEQIPQIYLPYKEALTLYNKGLEIPDDVTLCWVDDNFGYIRQLPTPKEQERSGGNGIYYHLSYLGTPAPYLWLSSMSPSFLSYELSKGYQAGIKRFWMFNVGDIKPAEEELQFCMDLAWNIEAWKPTEAYKYSEHWAEETFGTDVAKEISDIKLEYYALAAACKPELINRMDFTNEEFNERVKRYTALCDRVDALKSKIRGNLQDAFYELIEYPVKGAAEMNTKIIRARQSWYYAAAGIRDSALSFSSTARQAYQNVRRLTDKYNNDNAGGKWHDMMSYKPYGGSVYDMPKVATASDVFSYRLSVDNPYHVVYPADSYSNMTSDLRVLRNIGVSGNSIAVWPVKLSTYSSTSYKNAPCAEYNLHLRKGLNHITVRCLPTFPINSQYTLRVGVVIGSQNLRIKSIATEAMKGKWNTTVAEGFSGATFDYTVSKEGDIPVKVYFLDPAIVVSDILVEAETPDTQGLTDQFIVNADFELNASGQHASSRGCPYGWLMNVTPTGGSYGINNDAENPHGDYCCWVIARPFPEDFKLFQRIPASKLTPGIYKVSCILWNQNGNSGNCRLYANNSVQYFASAAGAANILTEGEYNTFAAHQGTTTADAMMKPMSVFVVVKEGDDLEIGIRTSNRKNDGTSAQGNDPTGWFKVDNFRIERISLPTGIASPISAQKTSTLYNLQGQAIPPSHALPKGIYIKNGKKFIY